MFLSQVKWNVIITNKTGTSELTEVLPIIVRLKEISKFSGVIFQSASQNKTIVNTNEKLLKTRYSLDQYFT